MSQDSARRWREKHPNAQKQWRARNKDKIEAYKKIRNTRDKERRKIAREAKRMEAEKKKSQLPHLVLSLEEVLRNKPKIKAETDAKAAPVKVFTAEERKALEAQLIPPSKIKKPEELRPLITAPIEEKEPMTLAADYTKRLPDPVAPGVEGFVPLAPKPREEAPSFEAKLGKAYLTVVKGKKNLAKIIAQIQLLEDDRRQQEISIMESQHALDNLLE